MRVAVLGATDATGRLVVEQGLARGHAITALVRRPQGLGPLRERITKVVEGDALDPEAVRTALRGQDAVISALGTMARGPVTLFSKSSALVLAAMHELGVERVVAIGAGGYVRDPDDPLAARWVVKPLLGLIFGQLYADQQRMEAVLRGSDLDWTIMQPARLVDGPASGYRRAIDRTVARGWRVTRADLAAACLDALEDDRTIRPAVGVAQ